MHTEYLTKGQLEVLIQLGPFMTANSLYLAGGTALALYYGHRQSVDLDWFSQNELGDVMILASRMQSAFPYEISQAARGTLHGQSGDVLVTVLEYKYPLLQPLYLWEEADCWLASLDDLACMKLSAIAQRGSRKDFLDLYHLVKRYKPLAELLALYQKKYGLSDVAPVLYGLAYFAEADEEPQPLQSADDWKTVKKAIAGWVKEIR